ncbi:MAG: cation:proton antiporter [Longimicrobiaceae bacterium]
MTEPNLIISLGSVVVAAAILLFALRPAGVPGVVAYIVAGLLLGPGLGLLEVGEDVELISEAGIALLLFLVGLELSLKTIRDIGRPALVAGTVQMAVTLAGAFGIARLAGFGATEALVIGAAMMFSSTVLVVKLLESKRELSAPHGRLAVGVLLVQDLVVIVVLTLVTGLSPAAGDSGTGAIALGLAGAFAGMAVLVGGALLASRWLLPRLFWWASRSPEPMFVWSVAWCFLLVSAAELLGLSPEIGGFLAGVSLAQLPYNQDLCRRVKPLSSFFIAVFFVLLGVRMELDAALAYWPAALALSLFVLTAKPLVLAVTLRWLGQTTNSSLRSGVALAQVSEFSFILGALALGSELIGEEGVSLIGVVGLATMTVSSFALLHTGRVAAWLGGAAGAGDQGRPAALQNHVIVVGMNSLGREIVERLTERDEAVLAIDTDPGKLAGLPADTLLGNVEYLSVLEEANLHDAKLLVSALQIEDTNNLLAYRCRRAGVPSSIHAFDNAVIGELRRIGVSHLMISKNDGIKRMAEGLQSAGVLER